MTNKYKVALRVNDEAVVLNPFFHDSLGNVLHGLLMVLGDIPKDADVSLEIDPKGNDGKLKFELKTAGALRVCKIYAQNLIWRTLLGFLNGLEDSGAGEIDKQSVKIAVDLTL